MTRFLRLFIGMLLIVASAIAYWAWLGWFGGDVYVPVAATSRPPGLATRLAAVLVSGDMGFKVGMARQVALRLAADGIPVLGVNSLVYFRVHRSPAEVARLLATAIRTARAGTGADRVVLIGQSFGADMVHVGLVALPPELRRRIARVILVVPTTTIDLKASPAEMLDLVADDGPALPTARLLDWVPTLCIFGRDETNSLCPLLRHANVHTVALAGGHPLRRDADTLYAAMRPAIRSAESDTLLVGHGS